MVGAGDAALDAPVALEQFMAAVLADIEEGAQFPILAADHQQGLAGQGFGQVAAALAQVAEMADADPGAPEDARDLALENGRVGVVARGQRPGAAGLCLERTPLPVKSRFTHRTSLAGASKQPRNRPAGGCMHTIP